MITNQCPSKALGLCIDDNVPKPIQKVDPISVLAEYLPALYAPDDEMMETPGASILSLLGLFLACPVIITPFPKCKA